MLPITLATAVADTTPIVGNLVTDLCCKFVVQKSMFIIQIYCPRLYGTSTFRTTDFMVE